MDLSWARDEAERLLAPLGPRWEHTREVAGKAVRAARLLPKDSRDEFVAAAWLHDIGYAPSLVATGFHPVDGARHLRHGGYEGVARLVAHHSCARFEAEERDLLHELAAFPEPPESMQDALTYCDMTTGPSGQHVTLDERLAEVGRRYGRPHLVTRSLNRARPCLESAVSKVVSELDA